MRLPWHSSPISRSLFQRPASLSLHLNAGGLDRHSTNVPVHLGKGLIGAETSAIPLMSSAKPNQSGKSKWDISLKLHRRKQETFQKFPEKQCLFPKQSLISNYRKLEIVLKTSGRSQRTLLNFTNLSKAGTEMQTGGCPGLVWPAE